MSISRVIRFGTGGELVNMKVSLIIFNISKVLACYHVRGFRVTLICADNGFAPLL